MLGRWSPINCDKTNAIKVFWANMDHCGTCTVEVKKEPAKVAPKVSDTLNKNNEITNKSRRF
jgi:hypothetical protein